MNAHTDRFWVHTRLDTLKGVGPTLAARLSRLGLQCLQDMLFHLPVRYQDRTRLHPIAHVRDGSDALIQGTISAADIITRKRRMLLVTLHDGTGQLQLRFFHFSAAQHQAMTNGALIRCFGEVRITGQGREMVHPEYQLLTKPDAPLHEALTPVYPACEGLSQNRLRQLALQTVGLLSQHPVVDWIPDTLRQQAGWPSLADALRYLHQPPPDADVQLLLERTHPSQRRLAAEELLAHHLSLLRLRAHFRSTGSIAIPPSRQLRQKLLDGLPFAPTRAQLSVERDILADLGADQPMLRLVQGDVGSGKTLVAALAAVPVIEAGYQVALMAPTEILAEQHWQAFSRWLAPLGLHTAWLAGKLKGKARQQQLSDIASGHATLIVGTHALFQEEVAFHRLALIIIDEQHRFGVHQRLSLREKGGVQGASPHQLIMTATPIPRTLAMSAYADLDTSVIDELPPGRTPVKTAVIDSRRRDAVIARVAHACAAGKQVYWVCTLIEESEALQCQAAEDVAVLLREQLPGVRIGLVHGRLKAAEKAAVMDAFKQGDLQLLVATTVIEVGVDVPNASVMIIENPERLGLAQLHQLRGRVGRGSQESYCLLMFQHPLSQHGRARLDIMRQTNDGFVIAEQDLALRGPGEVLGTRQTGDIQFRIADLLRDEALLPVCKHLAQTLLDNHPDAIAPLIDRWLGQRTDFAQV